LGVIQHLKSGGHPVSPPQSLEPAARNMPRTEFKTVVFGAHLLAFSQMPELTLSCIQIATFLGGQTAP
jgi:hypothetical protein